MISWVMLTYEIKLNEFEMKENLEEERRGGGGDMKSWVMLTYEIMEFMSLMNLKMNCTVNSCNL